MSAEAISSSSTSVSSPHQEVQPEKEDSDNLKDNQSSKSDKASNSSLNKSLSKDKVCFLSHFLLYNFLFVCKWCLLNNQT